MKALAGLVLLALLAACGSGGTRSDDGTTPVTIRVFAAASLTESFTELGKQFEAAHPGTTVEFNFGPSSGLAEQIGSGAPSDVFASASEANMSAVTRSGQARAPRDFVTNTMEIAVPPDNPAGITGLDSLVGDDVSVALCQPQVPCGQVAAEVFAKARITVKPVTEEVDVKSVLTKVTLGEVDAGLVYVTDVQAAGDRVTGIAIPAELNASTAYPIATLTASKHAQTASDFVDFVLSDAGSKVLLAAGFQAP